MDLGSHPPQQARSRRTLERLLAATVAVMEEEGLAGVTIPVVAARAGMATGSIYRRFVDKDALIRAAFLRLLEASLTVNRENLKPERFAGMSMERTSRALCRGLVRQFKSYPKLLKALDQFLESQTDAAFREQAVSMVADNTRRAVELLLPFRDRIGSDDPERAITFALLSAITVIETYALHSAAVWTRMLPLDDEALAVEAARAMSAYLASPEPDVPHDQPRPQSGAPAPGQISPAHALISSSRT
jgi:AcrR family transcriptional regulator